MRELLKATNLLIGADYSVFDALDLSISVVPLYIRNGILGVKDYHAKKIINFNFRALCFW